MEHLRLVLRGQRSTCLSLVLRGRCSTWSTSREVCGSPATIEYYGLRLLLRGRCSTWGTSVSFGVAGAALGASHCHFVWQVRHLENLILRGRCGTRSTSRGPLKSGDDCVLRTPAASAWQVAPSTLHHQTQHHPHNTIYTTLHHHIPAGAALGALPSYPFCLIPADTPLVILRGGLFFFLFSLANSTLGCPKTLLTCGVIGPYNFLHALQRVRLAAGAVMRYVKGSRQSFDLRFQLVLCG